MALSEGNPDLGPRASENRVALPGTEPPEPRGEVVGEVDPDSTLEVTVLLRQRGSGQDLEARLSQIATGAQPAMSREEYAASYGGHPDDLARVEGFARAYGLQVVESNPGQRRILLGGTAAAFGEAFGIHLRLFRDASGRSTMAPVGSISVPAELAGIVQGVFGLDDRPIARRG